MNLVYIRMYNNVHNMYNIILYVCRFVQHIASIYSTYTYVLYVHVVCIHSMALCSVDLKYTYMSFKYTHTHARTHARTHTHTHTHTHFQMKHNLPTYIITYSFVEIVSHFSLVCSSYTVLVWGDYLSFHFV